MHVISRRTLQEAANQKRYAGSGPGLDAWYQIARKAKWSNLEDVRRTFSAADGVTVGSNTYTVFNIGGNKFRLITKVEYRYQTIYIKHVLTHAEYDREEWKRK